MTAPSATSATTTTSVAIGLMKSDTVINAATLRTVLSATLNDVTTPLANPAKPPSSSCNRPLGSSCCTAHDVWRYASDKRCRASLSTATERSAETVHGGQAQTEPYDKEKRSDADRGGQRRRAAGKHTEFVRAVGDCQGRPCDHHQEERLDRAADDGRQRQDQQAPTV